MEGETLVALHIFSVLKSCIGYKLHKTILKLKYISNIIDKMHFIKK